MILEAMKMQNVMKAERSGTVKSVLGKIVILSICCAPSR